MVPYFKEATLPNRLWRQEVDVETHVAGEKFRKEGFEAQKRR